MVNLQAGTATGEGADTLSSIENVIGGSGQDVLTGNAVANSLYGGNGDDTLSGAGGNDRLFGGDDADFCNGGNGTDAAAESDEDAYDSVEAMLTLA